MNWPDVTDFDETFIIGFPEDGILYVTASTEVDNAADAQRVLDDWSGVWRVEEVHPVEEGDWCLEGAVTEPYGRRAWRLLAVTMSEIGLDDTERQNPLYDPQAKDR